MKIYSNAADNFVRDLKTNSVLIYGNDVGGVKAMAKRITKKFLGDEDEQESLVLLGADNIKDDPEIIITELNSKSFFSNKKIVILDDAPDGAIEVIERAISQINQDSFLLVCGGEMKKESKIRKFYEGSKNLTALLCYKEEGANLKRQISDFMRLHNVQTDYDTLEYLTANLGEDKLITQNELEKILIYLGDSKTLNLDDVTQILADNSDMALNDIAFAISCKNVKLLEKSLARAFADNAASIAVVRAALWHFNRLLTAKMMIKNGMQMDSVIESLRLFYKHKEQFKLSLRNWSEERLIKAVKALTQLELDLKANYADDEMLMRDKFLKMAA